MGGVCCSILHLSVDLLLSNENSFDWFVPISLKPELCARQPKHFIFRVTSQNVTDESENGVSRFPEPPEDKNLNKCSVV
jgi:hypothetical protein